jgi:hypothetical protein
VTLITRERGAVLIDIRAMQYLAQWLTPDETVRLVRSLSVPGLARLNAIIRPYAERQYYTGQVVWRLRIP